MVTEKQDSNNSNKVKQSLSEMEKRYIPRWEVANRILYQIENEKKTHESSSKDLSCTGACFATPENLPLNKKIKMKIYLSEDIAVKVEGQIVWNKPGSANENLVGVTFSNTSQEVQELILKHAFEIKKEDMIKYWFQGWNHKKPS